MKKLFICIAMMLALGVNNSSAQNVVRDGIVFRQVKGRNIGAKGDTLVTKFIFEDSKGNRHPIIINKGSGSCYVWRTSAKGKNYKSYMPSETSAIIAKEYGITYTPKKKK